MFSNLFKNKDNLPTKLDLDIAELQANYNVSERKENPEGLARNTVIALLINYGDLLAKTGQPLLAYRQLELAAALAETPELILQQLSRLMLTYGEFDLAEQAAQNILLSFPLNHDAHATITALIEYKQTAKQAQWFMKSFLRRCGDKIVPAQNNEALANILITYGYENTRYVIRKRNTGIYKRVRRGGHFMLENLLDEQPYHVNHYTIIDDNILKNNTAPAENYSLILNTIADPDVELKSLKTLEKHIRNHPDIPVINRPEMVAKTSRDNNYRRLNEIDGIRFARTERIDIDLKSIPENAAAIANEITNMGFEFPFIIRQTGTHTAVSTKLVQNTEELINYISDLEHPTVYAIEFFENSSEEGHYSKIRFFSIHGALYPVVYHTDQVWNVHGSNRKTFMKSYDWMIDREKKFLNDPQSVIGEDIYNRILALNNTIQLDFWGLDFTLLPNGDILIFELNPAMRHSFDHAKNFPYMEPYMQAIKNAFSKMIKNKSQIKS